MYQLILGSIRTLLLVLFIIAPAGAHNTHLPIIVDTDGGADDIRAIAMLMNSAGSNLQFIITSDGVLSPDQAKETVLNLAAAMNKPGIPVASGVSLDKAPPSFREINLLQNWPKTQNTVQAENKPPLDRLRAAVNQTRDCIYLCLGPMTNLARLLTIDTAAGEKIQAVIYLGAAPDDPAPGWNTTRDIKSAERVYNSGVPVYGLGLPDSSYLPFDTAFYTQFAHIDSETARLLTRLHDFPQMQDLISTGHPRIWDEMCVIYMNMVHLFEFEPVKGYKNIRQLKTFDHQGVIQAYFKLLGNPADLHLDARKSVVLNKFPVDSDMMRPDVAPIAAGIISTYGNEEWKACLLTNELHRHLGIYSLVGAKMGIRARELLDAPFDTLRVDSLAGLKPPLSCLNDGLQVSTGASLGRGTISVQTRNIKPGAHFLTDHLMATLVLKPEYVTRIKSDIRAALKQFGGLNPAYFAHIRKLSIQYWQEFDRNQLFEETITRVE